MPFVQNKKPSAFELRGFYQSNSMERRPLPAMTPIGHEIINYGAMVVVDVVGKSTFTIPESEIFMLQLSVTVTVSEPAVPPAVYSPLLSIVLPMLLRISQVLHGGLHSPFRVVLNCIFSQVYIVSLVGLIINSHWIGIVVEVVVG